MKKLMMGTAISLAIVAGAAAADLSPAPVYGKALPPAWSWSGCYVGGNVGGGWTNISAYDPRLLISDGNTNGSGVVGGGQIGCDYQIGSLVFGIQGMIDGTSIRGSGVEPVLPLTNSGSVPWLAALTGRIGFIVLPTTLIYAKGGPALARNNISTAVTATGVPFSSTGYTAGSGWIAGVGLEHMFMPHWSVFVEYDYLSSNTQTETFTNMLGSTFPINITQNVQMGIVGVNLRF
ncbi:MAG: outer membrane protein [Xanthobacteraceae bacterium]